MKKLKPINLKNIKTYSLKERASKVSIKDFGSSWVSNGRIGLWFNKLPNILAGSDFKKLVTRLTVSVKKKKAIILALGAHTIKVGLSPIILDLMERGIITQYPRTNSIGAKVIEPCPKVMYPKMVISIPKIKRR